MLSSPNSARRAAIVAHLTPLLALLLLLGCDGSRNPSPLAPEPPSPSPYNPGANLSGVWAGSYTSLADGVDQLSDFTNPVTASIEQDGPRVIAWLGTQMSTDPSSVYRFEGFMDGFVLFGTTSSWPTRGVLEGNRLTITGGYNRWELHR